MIHLYEYKLPLKNGTHREGIIIETPTGFGDIAPLPGFSKETIEEAKTEALKLLPDFPYVLPKLPSVRFAFDCAKTTIPNLKVPINGLNTYQKGFRALKMKVGHLSLQEALERIKNAPKKTELRLDFNQLWSLEKLLEFSTHFSPTDFAYLEEPTKKFTDLISFSKKTGFPIAVDESIPYVPYLQIPTLKALIIKPTILGMIPIPPPNVELIFSSAFESGIGVAHIARLAAIHNPTRPHGLAPYNQLQEDLLFNTPSIEDGFFWWKGPIQLEKRHLCQIA
jgi:O-succinylbenzoate synthase